MSKDVDEHNLYIHAVDARLLNQKMTMVLSWYMYEFLEDSQIKHLHNSIPPAQQHATTRESRNISSYTMR